MIEEAKNLIEKQLKKLNVEKWELLLTKTFTIENQFRGFDLEITRDYEILNYFLRIFVDKNDKMGIGVVQGSTLDEKIINETINSAIKMANLNSSIKYDLISPGSKYPTLDIAENKIISNPFDFIQDISEKLTNIISRYKGVIPTFGKLRAYINDKKLVNYLGLELDSKSTYLFIEYALKAESTNNLAEYWAKSYFKNSDQLDLENRIPKWAKIAKDTLVAKRPQLQKSATVLFPPIVLKDAFTNTIGFHITGKSKVEKISKIKIGDQIASKEFNLTDNGILTGGLRTHPWDGEGTPQRLTKIIENGVFISRIYDLKHAQILNKKSTGNGIRSSNGTIENDFTNLEISPGNTKLSDIISQIKSGVIVEEFSWLNPNRITGDFGAEIRNGYIIKNGEISTPIKGGNLSGNVFDMIKNIEFISIERNFEENTLIPYIVCKNLIISS